jgi:hypothetical protein
MSHNRYKEELFILINFNQILFYKFRLTRLICQLPNFYDQT